MDAIPDIFKFQHTAARRRLVQNRLQRNSMACFNTQPPEGGWFKIACNVTVWLVSTHSRPKAAGDSIGMNATEKRVSTHSRPKAAGPAIHGLVRILLGFNTQPPEGGWPRPCDTPPARLSFNTQPPEGGWAVPTAVKEGDKVVSTHSRPKAAGHDRYLPSIFAVCFNTQPPEGGWH